MTTTTSEQLSVFYSHMSSLQYIFRDGQVAVFRPCEGNKGRYATSKKKYIEELNQEVEDKHPHIYRDEKRLTITAEELEPHYELRKQIREEEKAKLLAGRDFGNYDASKGGANTGVASTASVAQAVVGSNEGGVKAALASLVPGKASATLVK